MTNADEEINPNVSVGSPSTRPALTLDVALYEGYLQDSNLTEDERRAFLEALWSIVVGFVDLGFGIHPLQQTGQGCGQDGSSLAFDPADVLSSMPISQTSKNTKGADHQTDVAQAKEES